MHCYSNYVIYKHQFINIFTEHLGYCQQSFYKKEFVMRNSLVAAYNNVEKYFEEGFKIIATEQ